MSDGRTHYEGCWRDHHDCAVAEIERLREKVENQKRETLSAVLNVIDYAIGGLTHTDGRPNWAIDSRDAAILNVLRDVRAQVAELAEGRSGE